jgi:hypothetical protein
MRVYEAGSVENINLGTALLFLESGSFLEHGVHCHANLISFPLIPTHEQSHCGKHCWWWLIKVTSRLESLTLDSFAIVVLVDATFAVFGATNHDIAQSNIIVGGWSAATDPDHQSNFDMWEAM